MPQENVYNDSEFVGQISFNKADIISIGSKSIQHIIDNTRKAELKDQKYFLMDGEEELGFIEKKNANFKGL